MGYWEFIKEVYNTTLQLHSYLQKVKRCQVANFTVTYTNSIIRKFFKTRIPVGDKIFQ